MIVCVLGMHKSGTTLVAETLHHSGVHMADVDDGLGYDDSNKYERHEAQAINRRLLAPASIPTWNGYRVRHAGLDRAGYAINRDSLALVRRGRLRRILETADTAPIAELAASVGGERSDWGFKDPRTCLTYELWARGLPEHEIVAVYRRLDEVLLRYRVGRASPIRLLRVARSWIVHNEMLLGHLAARPDGLLLRYDELMSGDGELDRLARHLGIDVADRRRADLYRARRDPVADGRSDRSLPRPIADRATRVEAELDERRRP